MEEEGGNIDGNGAIRYLSLESAPRPQVGHLPQSVQSIKLVIFNVGGRKE